MDVSKMSDAELDAYLAKLEQEKGIRPAPPIIPAPATPVGGVDRFSVRGTPDFVAQTVNSAMANQSRGAIPAGPGRVAVPPPPPATVKPASDLLAPAAYSLAAGVPAIGEQAARAVRAITPASWTGMREQQTGAIAIAKAAKESLEKKAAPAPVINEWTGKPELDASGQPIIPEETWARKAVRGGESVPSSMIPLVAGVAAGGLTAATGVGGPFAPIVAGMVTSGLTALGWFGASAYDEKKEEALKKLPELHPDWTPEQVESAATSYGLKHGAIEGLIEAIANPIETLTMGTAKAITTPGRRFLMQGIKNAFAKDLIAEPFQRGMKAFAKGYGKTVPVELGTEMLQTGLGTQADINAGMAQVDPKTGKPLDPWDAAMEVIGPTLFSTLLMSGGMHAVNSYMARRNEAEQLGKDPAKIDAKVPKMTLGQFIDTLHGVARKPAKEAGEVTGEALTKGPTLFDLEAQARATNFLDNVIDTAHAQGAPSGAVTLLFGKVFTDPTPEAAKVLNDYVTNRYAQLDAQAQQAQPQGAPITPGDSLLNMDDVMATNMIMRIKHKPVAQWSPEEHQFMLTQVLAPNAPYADIWKHTLPTNIHSGTGEQSIQVLRDVLLPKPTSPAQIEATIQQRMAEGRRKTAASLAEVRAAKGLPPTIPAAPTPSAAPQVTTTAKPGTAAVVSAPTTPGRLYSETEKKAIIQAIAQGKPIPEVGQAPAQAPATIDEGRVWIKDNIHDMVAEMDNETIDEYYEEYHGVAKKRGLTYKVKRNQVKLDFLADAENQDPEVVISALKKLEHPTWEATKEAYRSTQTPVKGDTRFSISAFQNEIGPGLLRLDPTALAEARNLMKKLGPQMGREVIELSIINNLQKMKPQDRALMDLSTALKAVNEITGSRSFNPQEIDNRIYVTDLQGRMNAEKLKPVVAKAKAITAPGTQFNLENVDLLSYDPTDEQFQRALTAHMVNGVPSLFPIGVEGAHTLYATRGQIQSIIDIAGASRAAGRTIGHEAWHNISQLLLNDKQRATLYGKEALTNQKALDQAEERAAKEFGPKLLEELGVIPKGEIKYGMLPASVSKIIKSMANFIQRFWNAIQGKGWQTVDDIFQGALSGEVRREALKSGAYEQNRARLKQQVKEQALANYGLSVKDVAPFVSKSHQLISSKMGTSMDAKSFEGFLKGKVKAEEMQWAGLQDLINKAKQENRPITKTEALVAIEMNIPMPEVRVLTESAAQFGNYSYTGGKNYREVLIKLPESVTERGNYDTFDEPHWTGVDTVALFRNEPQYRELLHKIDEITNQMNDPELTQGERDMLDIEKRGLRREANALKDQYKLNANLVADVLVDDRYTPDGKKYLFIQELQSKWHELGQAEGYQTPGTQKLYATVNRVVDGYREQYKKLDDQISFAVIQREVMNRQNDPVNAARLTRQIQEWETAAEALADQAWNHLRLMSPEELGDQIGDNFPHRSDIRDALKYKTEVKPTAVPPAPFGKTWHELALKVVQHMAVTEGYDGIAWASPKMIKDKWGNYKLFDDLYGKKIPQFFGAGDTTVQFTHDKTLDTPAKTMNPAAMRVDLVDDYSDWVRNIANGDQLVKILDDNYYDQERLDEIKPLLQKVLNNTITAEEESRYNDLMADAERWLINQRTAEINAMGTEELRRTWTDVIPFDEDDTNYMPVQNRPGHEGWDPTPWTAPLGGVELTGKHFAQVDLKQPLFSVKRAVGSFVSKAYQFINEKMGRVMNPVDFERMLKGKIKTEEMKWTGLNTLIQEHLKSGTPIAKAAVLNQIEQMIPMPKVEILDGPNTRYQATGYRGGKNYKEVVIRLPLSVTERNGLEAFQQGHFDSSQKQNSVVHILVDERETIDGKKILFVQEIQSDWHERGMTRGYKAPYINTRSNAPIVKELNEHPTLEAYNKLNTNDEQYAQEQWDIENDIKDFLLKAYQLGTLKVHPVHLNITERQDKVKIETGWDVSGKIKTAWDATKSGVLQDPKIRESLDKLTKLAAKRDDLRPQLAQALQKVIDLGRKTTQETGTAVSYDKNTGEFILGAEYGQEPMPDAPFSKTWHELGAKVLKQMAIDGNFDGIAWSTPDMIKKKWGNQKLFDDLYGDGQKLGQALGQEGKTQIKIAEGDQVSLTKDAIMVMVNDAFTRDFDTALERAVASAFRGSRIQLQLPTATPENSPRLKTALEKFAVGYTIEPAKVVEYWQAQKAGLDTKSLLNELAAQHKVATERETWAELRRRASDYAFYPSIASQLRYVNSGAGRKFPSITRHPDKSIYLSYAPVTGKDMAQVDAGLPLFSIRKAVGHFVSKAYDFIDRKMGTTMDPEAFRSMLKGKVKNEELEWTGINGLIEEHLKTGEPISKEKALDLIQEMFPAPTVQILEGDKTKYQSHMYMGGDNYREVIVRLPESVTDRNLLGPFREPHWDEWRRDQMDPNARAANGMTMQQMSEESQRLQMAIDASGRPITDPDNQRMRNRQLELERQALPLIKAKTTGTNVVLHLLVDDRKTADGKKVLFAQEIQSKWHEEGMAGGYKDKTYKERLNAAKLAAQQLTTQYLKQIREWDNTRLERQKYDGEVWTLQNSIRTYLREIFKEPNSPLKVNPGNLMVERVGRITEGNEFGPMHWEIVPRSQAEAHWGDLWDKTKSQVLELPFIKKALEDLDTASATLQEVGSLERILVGQLHAIADEATKKHRGLPITFQERDNDPLRTYGPQFAVDEEALVQEDIVPDAPFSKTWHELAGKILQQLAVDGNYDGVAWSTPDMIKAKWGDKKIFDDLYGKKMAQVLNPKGTIQFPVRSDIIQVPGRLNAVPTTMTRDAMLVQLIDEFKEYADSRFFYDELDAFYPPGEHTTVENPTPETDPRLNAALEAYAARYGLNPETVKEYSKALDVDEEGNTEWGGRATRLYEQLVQQHVMYVNGMNNDQLREYHATFEHPNEPNITQFSSEYVGRKFPVAKDNRSLTVPVPYAPVTGKEMAAAEVGMPLFSPGQKMEQEGVTSPGGAVSKIENGISMRTSRDEPAPVYRAAVRSVSGEVFTADEGRGWLGAIENYMKAHPKMSERELRFRMKTGRIQLGYANMMDPGRAFITQEQLNETFKGTDPNDPVNKLPQVTEKPEIIREPKQVIKKNLSIEHPFTDLEQNPMIQNLIKEWKGREFKDLIDIKDDDLTTVQRALLTPWWMSKQHPELRPLIDIELNREEQREELYRTLTHDKKNEGMNKFLALPNDQAEDLFRRAIVLADKTNKRLTNEELMRMGFNEAQIEAYGEWNMAFDRAHQAIADTFDEMQMLAYQTRPYFKKLKEVYTGQKPVATARQELIGSKHLEEFNKDWKMLEKAHTTIKEMRSEMNKITAYMPRVRAEGDWIVKVIDRDGNILHAEKAPTKNQAALIKHTLMQNPSYRTLEIKAMLDKPTPESIFQSISDNSLQVFLDKAGAKLQAKEQLSPEDAEELTEALKDTLVDMLKARGFGRHMISRFRGDSPISGYKTEGGKEIFNDYMRGLSGFITKQKAAYALHAQLGNLDSTNKPQLYTEAASYVKELLRNQETLDRISGKLRMMAFGYYLAGNLKSASLQFTQNFVTGIPMLGQYTKGSDAKYTQAMRDITLGRVTDEESKAIHKALDRGIATAQYFAEVTGRIKKNTTNQMLWALIDLTSKPFQSMEVWNRKSAFLAAYRVARQEKGMGPESAFTFARDFVYDTHYLMGKANLPAWARGGELQGAAARTAYTFRSFTHNYAQSLYEAYRKAPDGPAALSVLGHSMAWLAVFGGAMAMPFLGDLLDDLEKLTGTPYRHKLRRWLRETGGETLEKLGMNGLPGLFGVDLSGSLAMGLPGIPGISDQTVGENVAGVWGGLADKFIRSGKALSQGDLLLATEKASPVAIENILKAYRTHTYGITSTKGKLLTTPTGQPIRLTPEETALQALSFRPERPAALAMEHASMVNIQKHWADKKDSIYTRMRTAKTQEDQLKVYELAHKYNRDVQQYHQIVPRIDMKELGTLKRPVLDKKYRAFDRL